MPNEPADLTEATLPGLDRALIEAITAIGQAVVVVEDGRARFVNQAFSAITGYDVAELLAFPSILDLVTPEQRAEIVDRMERRLAGDPAAAPRYEATILHKDGRRVEVEASVRVWQRAGASPLVVVLARDITGPRQTEAALRASELRFRQLVHAADDLIFTMDAQGRFTFVNPAASRLLQCDAADLIGTDFLELVRPDYREQARAFYRRQVDERVPATSFEFPAMSRDGREVWFNQTVQLITDADRIVTVQAIARDITEQRLLEAQLRQAQKMDAVGRLAGGIAHDFNNLMTIILGCVDMARMSLPADASIRADLRHIQEAAERATTLTQQLLGFGRKQMVRPRPLRVAPLIAGLCEMLARLIGEHITIGVDDRTVDGGMVRADPAQIEQVVMNLALNARDAMPSGGRLTLGIRHARLDYAFARTHPGAVPGEYISITVADTGLGMAEDVRAHAFEPFFTTKEPGSGTGLGLSTVYGIVKQNNGYVWIDSTPGQGTCVSVYLPRVAEPAAPPEPLAPTPVGRLTGSETILIVEDEENVARLAARILTRFRYTVLSASNAEDALRVASNEPRLDMVVSDLVMSGMDGVELCRRLTEMRPQLRLLLVSGYHDRAADIERAGFAFLGKPYTPIDLARKVRAVLDKAPHPERG